MNNFLQARWTLWRGDGCLAFLVSPVICLYTVSEIRGCYNYKFLKFYQKTTEFAKKHTLKSLWSNPHSHQNINNDNNENLFQLYIEVIAQGKECRSTCNFW